MGNGELKLGRNYKVLSTTPNLLVIFFLNFSVELIFLKSVNALATAVNDKNLGQFAKNYDV